MSVNLDEIVLREFGEGVVKLHTGEDRYGKMGYIQRASVQSTNNGKMSCAVTISSQAEDRSGDIVVTKGIDLTDHKKNPISLIGHQRDYPIGFTEDRLGAYTVKMLGDTKLSGEIFFNQGSALAEDVFVAVEKRVIRGTSIGFLPKKIEKRNGRGTLYQQSSLIEISLIPIPDHQDCLVEAVFKGHGGKPYGEQLLAILRPLCPPKNETVVGGFDAATLACRVEPVPEGIAVEKQYGQQDDTLLGGGQDDQMMGDDMTDPNDPHAGQESSDTEQAWLTIAIDLVQQAMAHDESALKKLGMLLKTRKKLIVGGDDGDIMDMAQDEPEEGDEDEVDFETPDDDDEDDDGETDAPGPQGKKKKKQSVVLDKGYVWRERDCDAITYVYKTLTSIACTPFLDREKMDPFVYEAIKQLEAITPIERGIVEKKIKTPHKTRPAAVAQQEQEEDLTAILLALDESDAEREARCRQRDRKLFSIFGR